MNSSAGSANPLYLQLPPNVPDLALFVSPKHDRTGSNFTELKSGRSNRSRYSSNSKLLKSSLFKIVKRGTSNFVQTATEQRNL
jgi:hypothetical protein